MREHAHLAAMMGFVSKHVAEHLQPSRPGLRPGVSPKFLDAALAAESFSQHLRAASGALGQSRAGLLRSAMRAIELRRRLQMRCCKPDPFGADIVDVSKDRSNCADVPGWPGAPCAWIKAFDEKLIQAIVGSEDPDRGPLELVSDLLRTRAHGANPRAYDTRRVKGPLMT